MRNKSLLILISAVPAFLSATATAAAAIDSEGGLKARAFVGQDLHLQGRQLLSYSPDGGEHTLVFGDGFSMTIGDNRLSSDSAVVWLTGKSTEFRGQVRIDYSAKVYLAGNVSVDKGKNADISDLNERVIEEGESMVVRFDVSGEVFVTAEKRESGDPRGLELYKKASAEVLPESPRFVVQPRAVVPEWHKRQEVRLAIPEKPAEKQLVEEPAPPTEKESPTPASYGDEAPKFMYPVNISPAGASAPKIESTRMGEGMKVTTLTGRFYLWQKQEKKGRLLELQADTAVVFHSGRQVQVGEEQTGTQNILAKGAIKDIYVAGDVVMTEGQRTIRADELYYDFQRKKALAVNTVMRSFDVKRGIPIYVRAAKLRQIAENKFSGEDMTLTSSEFYRPQISLTASKVLITDTTTIDEQADKVSDSSFDAQMEDVRIKAGERTIFRWPFMRSNMQRPDIPIESIHIGHDSTWGTSLETRWYLSRLMGLQEPEGVDATLAADYYSERGPGGGVEIDYEKENYYGAVSSYLIRDSGEDRLGRHSTRKDIEPDRKLRGRFDWQHRQFLPYNWQLTTGVGYASDEHFTESYYRDEFNTTGRQETYIHLKRIEDNWGLSFLGKGRINDFDDVLEELPTAEFHLTGQSLFEDTFTLYSDTQVSRLRQRIGNEHSINIDEDHYSFLSHRTELDMPILAGGDSGTSGVKLVPFVAGTFGYDDRSGFTRTLVDGSNTGSFGEDKVWLGEAGVRVFPSPYWKVYENVKSRLWDLNRLRHIIRPELTAVLYEENDDVVRQHDTLQLGLSQRLQTKRRSGLDGKESTVDWMRLDTDIVWVKDSEQADAGPDKFIWNKPFVPLRVLSSPEIFNGDLTMPFTQTFEMFGPRRNYFGADYIWRLGDTTAILSDMNVDMQSWVVQQFDIGFSQLRWPDLSYYIGSRYLRRVQVGDEEGSNALTFAATYKLDPRYTLMLAQQFDFDYGANIRSDITLVRRYHRIYCGLTYSADQSLDRQAIVFSIWPQGVPELAIGQRRYMGYN